MASRRDVVSRLAVAIAIGMIAVAFAVPAEAAFGVFWSSQSPSVRPPAGQHWAYTHAAVPRSYGSANWDVYLYAGESGGILYRWTKGATNWEKLTPSQSGGTVTPRSGACLAYSGQRAGYGGEDATHLILYGGRKTDNTLTKELNIYNVATNDWFYKREQSGDPEPREYPGCARINTWEYTLYPYYDIGIILVGGKYSNGTYAPLNEVWIFCDIPSGSGTCAYLGGRHWERVTEVGNPPTGGRYQMVFVEASFDETGHSAGLTLAWNWFGGFWHTGRTPVYYNDARQLIVDIGGGFFWDLLTKYGDIPSARYGAGSGFLLSYGSPCNGHQGTGFVLYGGSPTQDKSIYKAVYCGYVEPFTATFAKVTWSGNPTWRTRPVFSCANPTGPNYWSCFDNSNMEMYLLFGGNDGANQQDTWLGTVTYS